jgi:Leucine-rich repeat (LRR) protein
MHSAGYSWWFALYIIHVPGLVVCSGLLHLEQMLAVATVDRHRHSITLRMWLLLLPSQEEQLGSSCSLSAIRSLDVSGLRIRDVGSVFVPGTPFASLAELVLDDNTVSSLAPLAGLAALQVLKLSNNRLGEADPACISFAMSVQAGEQAAGSTAQNQQQLQSLLPNLQVLQLSGNGLTSLRPLQLQWLPGLRSLFVGGNELQRLDGLEGLGQLRELVADRNKIR